MAHFAQLENNLVIQVIVINNNDIIDELGNESEAVGIQFCTNLLGGEWIQTSYNGSFRKNYGGIGYNYDTTRDAFIEPQPYPSWILDEDTCQYKNPIPYPDDVLLGEDGMPNKYYEWDESATSWIEV